MTAPIEAAWAALILAASAALVTAEFIPSGDKLEIDPPTAFAPNGEEGSLITAAALLKLETGATRTFMGGGVARYEVERSFRFELAAAGPDAAAWQAALQNAVIAIVGVETANPTLGGTTLRLVLAEATDDDLPPNGNKKLITGTIAVRSLDRFGMT